MLQRLSFRDVGPAPSLEISLRERLNFLTGDNGLGKTFLLDAAWWALTRTWARSMLMPHRPPAQPEIAFEFGDTPATHYHDRCGFDREREAWTHRHLPALSPGLVLYAQVDGGFSVWDPARNRYAARHPSSDQPTAYLFSAAEVWSGLPLNEPMKLCNGLIADWASWQLEGGEAFDQLRRVLKALAPSFEEPLEPGELVKVSLRDARRHPTLRMPYGQEVPLIHVSAGIRRIVALAYLLVWTWQEHVAASELLGVPPTRQIIFLIDEIEAHLHPQWQRRIVPALLDVMEALTGQHDVPIQLIAATHSPLVLASAEARFDPVRDAVWELDLRSGEVELHPFPWVRRGDANAWLTSSVFDLKEPRSIEAERAILDALTLLRQEAPDPTSIKEVDGALRAVLSDVDRFWVRWSYFVESARGDA